MVDHFVLKERGRCPPPSPPLYTQIESVTYTYYNYYVVEVLLW